jgi:hypothetical protein
VVVVVCLDNASIGCVIDPILSSGSLFTHMHVLGHMGMYLLDQLWIIVIVAYLWTSDDPLII